MVNDTQQIPVGYKQTDVGIIPEDWGLKKLGSVCDRITTGKLDANAMKMDGSYRFYTCARDYYFIDNYAFDDEALLISGNGANVGYIHYYKGKFNAYQRTYVLTGFSEDIFFTKLLLDKNLKERIRIEVNAGNTPYITMGTLSEMNIPYPTLRAEQEKIAEALSDIDSLISKLDQLIQKKKNIKQGAMQELLTGKRRLPGFTGEWKLEKVDDFGEIVTGGTPPTSNKSYWNGHIPWITPTDINKSKDIFNSERQITASGLSRLRKLPSNSVLVTCIASIGKNAILKRDGACNQQINAIIPNKQHSSDFIYYLMELNKEFLLSNAGITATNIISKKDFTQLEFSVPDLKEQIEIASVLAVTDTELEKVIDKKSKYQKLKQGMMQQLLTGKIRLI
jgi:type I restriction enzyme S subunit